MLAAHETTASALAWAMERLTHHPDVRALVEQDLAEGDHRYLDAVIAETLRQRPPVLVVARRVASPIQLGGWRLPAGVNVAAALHLLQHRPDRYPEPDCFRPERFLDRRPDGYAWIAFGGGVRRCIGASLALLELRLILQRLLARYELGPAVGAPEVPSRQGLAVMPARGGRVVLHPRATVLEPAVPEPVA